MDPADFSHKARTGDAITMLDEVVAQRGTAIAIDGSDRALSYTDLKRRSDRFAGGLADRGIEPSDRVMLYLPNCPAYVIAAVGAIRAGAPVSPANPQYRARELGYQLEDSKAAAIVTHDRLRERVATALADRDLSPTVITVGNGAESDVRFNAINGDLPSREPDQNDVIMHPYTSGTTGRPKGVLLTHRNLRAQAFAGLDTDLPPDDERGLVYLPLYHITGFVHSTWQALVRGATVVLRDPAEWDPGIALRTIESMQITNFIGVSTMFVDMVNHDEFGAYDLSSLENVGEGGAKMPVAVQRKFEATAGVEMTEGYGLTETTGATHSGSGSTFGHQVGTVGQPLRMTDCKLVDESGSEVPVGETGELLVRGPQVMKGYHDRPDATDKAFTGNWFHTGDIARRDVDNYYEIVDRIKHVINTAGYNVYPSEVESVLFEHPAVEDAAVVGVPDDRRGETVKAFVVQNEPVTADAIREYCLDRLAPYKHPRTVAFVDELPRTASGKVQKFKLVEDESAR